MADAAVTFLLKKAIDVASDRIGPMLGLYDELKAMEGHAKDIQAVLTDAEAKKSRNPIVLRWLKKVEVAAFEAELVLDELLYESLRRKAHECKHGGGKVSSFFSQFKHDISFRMRMGSRVRGINKKLKMFNLEIQSIGLVRVEDSMLHRDTNVTAEALSRETDSLPDLFIAGRAKEEFEIVKMLLMGSSNNNISVSVLPIVGMGGLGKTTLAKSIYNNEKIVNHFSKRSWICVSDKFDVTRILKGVLESLKGVEKLEISSRDAIVRGIQKELNGEKFLFVLDDVWKTDPNSWDSLFTSFVGLSSMNESCCILTTRLQTTADLVCASSFNPFVLGKLSGDDCWSIIGRKATKGGEMPVEFEVYKEKILGKCQGLPLAAKAIGGLLSSERKDKWISIIMEVLKVRAAVEGDIMPILKLSYDYLPSQRIKKCFAYCSVYSKDAKLIGQTLIELWMAEGYLQDNMQERTTMEEDGARCLAILLQNSLLEKIDGYFYQMHDLVHNLAESILEREQFDHEYRYLQCRNLALYDKEIGWNCNAKAKLAEIVKCDVSNEMLLKYKHVRVLQLYITKDANLPSAIGKLKHVRRLDLSGTGTKSVPESICTLYNLQTLMLHWYGNLENLPQGLRNLVSLRHLYFYTTDSELKMPAMIGQLTNLQTLEFFNIGNSIGHGIEELGSMRNLKGRIVIRNLELVRGKEEAGMANLVEKNLTGLSLCWSRPVDRNNRNDESVLEGLEPCSTLKNLRIENYLGTQLPQWLKKVSSLVNLELAFCEELVGFDDSFAWPNLKSLSIDGCHLFSSYIPSRHFLGLENLTIKGRILVSAVRNIIGRRTSIKLLSISHVVMMSSLSQVIETPLAYSLKELRIQYCDNLIEIPSSALECFPNLELLEVGDCKKLLSCPLNLQRTSSLSTIKFEFCPNLFITCDVPRGFIHLTNLKELSIGPFSDDSIQAFDWPGLIACSTTLQVLHLGGSPNSFLPEQLRHFSSLVKLEIHHFESLESLPDWFGNLTSLKGLYLTCCPRLRHFPLTHIMERLRNLRRLSIFDCPLLKEIPGREISGLPNLSVTVY